MQCYSLHGITNRYPAFTVCSPRLAMLQVFLNLIFKPVYTPTPWLTEEETAAQKGREFVQSQTALPALEPIETHMVPLQSLCS